MKHGEDQKPMFDEVDAEYFDTKFGECL